MAERELATVLGPFDDHLAPHEIFMNASHEDSATAVAAGWPELESRWTNAPGFRETLHPAAEERRMYRRRPRNPGAF